MFQCTMDHLTNPIIIGHSGCFHFPILDIVAMNILIHASFTPNQLFLKKYIYRNTYKVGIKLSLPQCYCLSPQSRKYSFYKCLIFSTQLAKEIYF